MKRRIHRKEKKQKKIIITLSVFLIIFISVGYAAFETNISLKAKGNIYNKGDLCYTTSDNGDGTVTITEYDETCGTEVNIPSKIKGKTVTKIGKRVFNEMKLTSVILSNTLTKIDSGTFEYNKISSLEIPSSVEEIGAYAFRHNNISKLTLHEGLKSIGLDAFQDNYLTEINIPKSVTYLGGGTFAANLVTGEEAFIYDRNDDGSINYAKLDSYAGKDATGTTIPETVTELGNEAYYTVKYKKIDVPSRIKIITGLCFADTGATEVTLHEGLEEIYGGAFASTNISSIDIPSTVTKISTDAFTYGDAYVNKTIKTININKIENSITGAPWGAINATINWTGTN